MVYLSFFGISNFVQTISELENFSNLIASYQIKPADCIKMLHLVNFLEKYSDKLSFDQVIGKQLVLFQIIAVRSALPAQSNICFLSIINVSCGFFGSYWYELIDTFFSATYKYQTAA